MILTVGGVESRKIIRNRPARKSVASWRCNDCNALIRCVQTGRRRQQSSHRCSYPTGSAARSRSPPPQAYFVGSAVFHYLGPSFAVLLFARVDVLGVAWLRIASAAAVFAVWRRPWRRLLALDRSGRLLIVGLGAVFAVDERDCFYSGDRPAAAGDGRGDRVHRPDRARAARRPSRAQRRRGRGRGRRRLPAHERAASTASRSASRSRSPTPCCSPPTSSSPIASHAGGQLGGVDGLAAAMLLAFVVVSPIGLGERRHAFDGSGRARRRHRRRRLVVGHPVRLRPAGDGTPRACDLRAVRRAAPGDGDGDRRRRAATSCRSLVDLVGIALVMLGVAVHRPDAAPGSDGKPQAVGDARAA